VGAFSELERVVVLTQSSLKISNNAKLSLETKGARIKKNSTSARAALDRFEILTNGDVARRELILYLQAVTRCKLARS